MGGCLSKCSSYSENELKFEILKHPGRVDSVAFSCDLDVKDCREFVGFTKTGKVFYTRNYPGVLGLLDQRSKKTLATFDAREIHIDIHTPTQRSPHPAAELPNEPPEGTWPVYHLPDPWPRVYRIG
ncbi:uncharacterized protein LOC110696206 [Chenopodium quinoa]|uniref:uncharacterized protein LOC110696206 n=1 Tax=Chenopodium quinoa TaxID=63459 RepID=UPI000B7787BA|nr:uncharacterized protein LOC110696206 [Chenopodium quinoa]